jgi:hypothetical protein
MNGYQHEWEAYSVRRRKLVLCIIAVFLGFIPFLLLVAFIDRRLFSSTSLVFPATLVWGGLYLFTSLRLRVFACPRCGKNFNGGFFHDPADVLARPKAFFGRECVYCGLRKFAESDDDIDHASSRRRPKMNADSTPISSGLKMFLAGAAGTLIFLMIAYVTPSPRRNSVLAPLAPEAPAS